MCVCVLLVSSFPFVSVKGMKVARSVRGVRPAFNLAADFVRLLHHPTPRSGVHDNERGSVLEGMGRDE